MIKPKIKLIIFDAAGVTWNGGVPVTSRYIAKKYKLPFMSTWDVFDRHFIASWKNNLQSYEGWDTAAKELGLKLTGRQIERIHLSLHLPVAEMIAYSDDLRSKGYKTIILSNNFGGYVEKFKKKFQLGKHFDEVLNSQDLGMGKNDPRLFKYVMKKYNVKAQQAIYFDDLERGLAVPKRLGINTVHYKNFRQLKKEVEKLLTPIKLVVLDFHGVILLGSMVELSRWIAKKTKQSFEDVHGIVYKDLFNRAAMGEFSEFEFFRRVAKLYPQVGGWQDFRKFHINAQKLNKKFFKIALKLRDLGYEILLLSKNTPPQFNDYKKKFKLTSYFKNIINTYDLRLPKAGRETIDHICKLFNVKPEEMLFIDDQKENLVEPGKLGVKTIFYQNFNQAKNDLDKILS